MEKDEAWVQPSPPGRLSLTPSTLLMARRRHPVTSVVVPAGQTQPSVGHNAASSGFQTLTVDAYL